jgi:hypothetical protein
MMGNKCHPFIMGLEASGGIVFCEERTEWR